MLGYRKDIPEILSVLDLYTAMSKREGLPVNLLEARIMNLPIITTNTRGQRELVKEGENGYVVEIGDVENLKEKIGFLYNNPQIMKKFSENTKKDLEKYYLENVYKEVKKVYLKIGD